MDKTEKSHLYREQWIRYWIHVLYTQKGTEEFADAFPWGGDNEEYPNDWDENEAAYEATYVEVMNCLRALDDDEITACLE